MNNREKFDRLNSRFSELKSMRIKWDTRWNFLAARLDPKNANFNNLGYSESQADDASPKFDSTATYAVQKWAAAIDALTSPKTQKWHNLTCSNEYLADKYRAWFEQTRDRMFKIRYSAGSKFATANFENIKMLGAYGSGPFSVTENYGRGIEYKAWPLKEFYVAQNFLGEVDTFFRNFYMTTRQARQQFGEDCPKDIIKENNLEKEWEFLHCVYPNEDYKPGLLGKKFKKFASDYLCMSTSEIISEGGFDLCPFIYSRFDVFPDAKEAYGYAPSFMVLPEIRTLNQMIMDNLSIANRAATTTVLASDDEILTPDKLNALGIGDTIIPGGLDASGQARLKEMGFNANLAFALEFIQDQRNVIKEGFCLDLLQMIISKPNMTATEVLQLAQQQATMISPQTTRRESEHLSPVVALEYMYESRAGQFEPMPQELAEAMGSGEVKFSVQYESPITRAQSADEGQAILQVLNTAAFLQQFDPTIKNEIHAPRTLKRLSTILGAPVDIYTTDEEKTAAAKQQFEVEQAQQMLAAAPVISKAAKDMAEAQATTGALI